MDVEKPPKAIDLRHHLSDFARAELANPFRAIQKIWGRPGSISLAGGSPSAVYFPFNSITTEALVPDSFSTTASEPQPFFSWLLGLLGARPPIREKTSTLVIPKYVDKPGDLCLSTALQYGHPVPQLQEILYNFTANVHLPAYEDFTTLVHIGNTDGWHKVMETLCNKGDFILASEWTYACALSAMIPFGIKVAHVAIDGQGMRSDSLRGVLKDWDELSRGAPRPHVVYIIPTGQNPSGTTMGSTRKKDIYAICVEYDVIIVEDDPYYFLQQTPYIPKAQRKASSSTSIVDGASYVSGLVPSFLRFDYEGRVIRMDTFSKTIAPGSRLGWFTCSPPFAEKLGWLTEKSTPSPSGFSQSLVTQLLTHWKYEGYIRWLRALSIQYSAKRDHCIDCLHDEFDLQLSTAYNGLLEGDQYYLANKFNDKDIGERCSKTTMFSFIPPTSGMFIWIKLHFENLPAPGGEDQESLEVKLWTKLAEAGVLLAPGWIFSTDPVTSSHPPGEGHFRISFSECGFDDMKKAITIFGQVLREFFDEV